jgi:hypothetical protein
LAVQRLWHAARDRATFALRPKHGAGGAKVDNNNHSEYVFMQGLDSKDKIAPRLQPGARKIFAPWIRRARPNAAIDFRPNSCHVALGY